LLALCNAGFVDYIGTEQVGQSYKVDFIKAARSDQVFSLLASLDLSDPNAQKVVFEANVPNDNWLSIGFGESMYSTDMVGYIASGDGKTLDTWSTGHFEP
jgi:hypothetical protein